VGFSKLINSRLINSRLIKLLRACQGWLPAHQPGQGSLAQRMGIAAAVMLLLIVGLDLGGAILWNALETAEHWKAPLTSLDISFAPEVWLSVIGVTLGTLVIAISIAAQNIPKITELYMQDWFSLLYMWFLIFGGCHAVVIKAIAEAGSLRPWSLGLNIYGLLPIAIVLGFPYVFYVLRTIQPTTVIEKIYERHLQQLRGLVETPSRRRFEQAAVREAYHRELLESLNQLENLLEYLAFKEPKLQIIQRLSQLLQRFTQLKPRIDPQFFKVSDAIRSDVSFQTMIDQLPMQQQRNIFYEQKVFRLLGNAYVQFLEDASFDLAALCGAEVRRVGSVSMTVRDQWVLDLVVVRFNTMLRFALKHGVTHNEARNLYNLIFHYRGFIEDLIRQQERQKAQQCFHYLRNYGNEAYVLGKLSPALYFIVDVFAAEMRSLLILVYEQDWPLEVQHQLLEELLQIDSPPQSDPLSTELKHLNSGVRTLQISLALFYLHVGLPAFAKLIAEDLLDDCKVLGEPVFRETVQGLCDRLQTAQPIFWEDTDRGTENLYYTPHHQYIDQFNTLLEQAIQQAGLQSS
jgi:uncharacterized protein YbgA (DUF1722 family)